MATITASTTPESRTRPGTRTVAKVRAALTSAGRKGTTMAGAARHHDWSPVPAITGLAAIDIAAWETFGRGAAWLATGVSLLLYDWARDR